VGRRITPADFDSITNEFSKLGSVVGASLRYSDGLDDLETVAVSVGSIEGSKVGTKVSDVGRYVGDVEGAIVRTFSNVGFEVGRREGVIVGLLEYHLHYLVARMDRMKMKIQMALLREEMSW
jgi:hypothetical protein